MTRPEIADEFGPWLRQLQFRGEGYRDGAVFESFGICYVPNPYGPVARMKKEVKQSRPPESNLSAKPPLIS